MPIYHTHTKGQRALVTLKFIFVLHKRNLGSRQCKGGMELCGTVSNPGFSIFAPPSLTFIPKVTSWSKVAAGTPVPIFLDGKKERQEKVELSHVP